MIHPRRCVLRHKYNDFVQTANDTETNTRRCADRYVKGAFRKKGFDGTPWPLAKKDRAGTRRRGSLMVDSAALMNSVRIARATPQEVVWTAGNDKVPYAEVHNTGGRAGRGRGFQMPKRQYMGDAEELRRKIIARIRAYMESRINK